MNPNKLRDVGPIRRVKKKQRKQASALQPAVADGSVGNDSDSYRRDLVEFR